jgi:hypothetical protein
MIYTPGINPHFGLNKKARIQRSRPFEYKLLATSTIYQANTTQVMYTLYLES